MTKVHFVGGALDNTTQDIALNFDNLYLHRSKTVLKTTPIPFRFDVLDRYIVRSQSIRPPDGGPSEKIFFGLLLDTTIEQMTGTLT